MTSDCPLRTRLLENGLVVNVIAGTAARADILITDERIQAVGEPGSLTVEPETVRLDMCGKILIPGLVNVHVHGHGFFSKGMGDRWPLELLIAAGPWISGRRQLDDKRLIGLIGAIEMVSKGTTACYDLFAETPRPTAEGLTAMAEAYARVGIRATIAPMMSDIGFYDAVPGLREALPVELAAAVNRLNPAPYSDSIEACREITDGSSNGDIRFALGPTIPLHCSEAFLRACGDLAEERQLGLQTHLAESRLQALAAKERYGHSLISELDRLSLLRPGFTAAHAIWLCDADLDVMAERGVAVAHNPGSNMRLGTGISRVRDMLDRGILVGIGTDTCSCSDNLNMFEAMRGACYASRIRDSDHETWLEAPEILRAATIGGARILGRDDEIGQIAPGYLADIVCLSLERPHYMPVNDPIRQVVFCEDGTGVDRVIVGGRDVVVDGRVLGVDLADLSAAAAATLVKLTARVEPMRALFEKVEPHVSRFYRSRITCPI